MTSANSVRQYERRSMHPLPSFISSPHNHCFVWKRGRQAVAIALADASYNIPLFLLRFAFVYTVNVFLIGLGHLNNDITFEIVTIIRHNAISSVQTFHPSPWLCPIVSLRCFKSTHCLNFPLWAHARLVLLFYAT